MKDTDKIKCFNALMDTAERLEVSTAFRELAGVHMNVGTMGVTLTMLRDMPSGETASAQHLLAWEEIALTTMDDRLNTLATEMFATIMAHN